MKQIVKKSLIIERARQIIEDKKKIHDHIAAGKDISELKNYGIKFAQPL